ncbi:MULTISPECIES: phage head closure protein [unclassified Bacillus (in: firmicutes)]|uniref:phage head closure protein n=1 Tax=unclassified Bacillus (in: firmicutes) TaxID=185979 RepID=UPI0008F30EA0|nr:MULTISPECIES: phage head closure protein [unclassified Bacillus (in: firmicutes)]SFI36061.1 phage head-tail adaptor, putative, SPP1 family [Bacillus sp. 71mf]SFS34887.1 phage head-tail adaptor, putative, SPP1 family [Bacillus sp. 103mf]
MNDILWFPIVTTIEDELGQKEEIATFSRQVFCRKKSIPQSEFFQAGQSGIKASCILIVHYLDYQEETKVKYGNKTYSIYRIYERDDEKIELYCEVKASDRY